MCLRKGGTSICINWRYLCVPHTLWEWFKMSHLWFSACTVVDDLSLDVKGEKLEGSSVDLILLETTNFCISFHVFGEVAYVSFDSVCRHFYESLKAVWILLDPKEAHSLLTMVSGMFWIVFCWLFSLNLFLSTLIWARCCGCQFHSKIQGAVPHVPKTNMKWVFWEGVQRCIFISEGSLKQRTK